MQADQVIAQLQEMASPAYHAGMARFGINSDKALGVKIPDVRKLAKAIKRDHEMAMALWESGIHEARILATMLADPTKFTPADMDRWASQFYSWDICDQACGNLFDRTPFAIDKAFEYSKRNEEFVKRAGFVIMAEYAVHAKNVADDVFLAWLPVIEREAHDDRNFVRKGINWALRQIGKRNTLLMHAATAAADRILQQDTKAAQWIATDALREFNLKKASDKHFRNIKR